MKRLAATFVCLALLLALPEASWQHVHAHGHDEHHALGRATFHSHGTPVGHAPAWRSHGPDEDARSLGGFVATSGIAGAARVATLNATALLPAPPAQPLQSPEAVSRGHDPPRVCRSGPRAPPA